MITKLLKCIAYEDVLRILNIIHHKKKIKEVDLYEVLDIPKYEIHKHIKELVNLDILIEEEIDLETVYSFDMSNLKRIRFLEVLLEDLKHENIFSIDLRNL
ncbi:MAG: hypothetical protein KBF12_10205 [Sebaldella sp.]|nr:hypothetical protein [Sebaldella sp.]